MSVMLHPGEKENVRVRYFGTVKTAHPFGPKVESLLHRMVSPLMGLDKTIGFSLHDRGSAGVFVSVAQLTAVHRLLGWSKPLSYHLGGYGLRREEAMIRALGETLERYAHMTILLTKRHPHRFASANELQAEGLESMKFDAWNFFPDEFYTRPKFAFQPFDARAPITWIETWSLTELRAIWAPAQLLVLGYRCRTKDGEPWMSPAFTTGTAAHTVPERALKSALLELLQMDAAMGCWHAGKTAPTIELDGRLDRLKKILQETRCSGYDVQFHLVESAGFDIHVVACVLRARGGEVPACAVGIASDTRLESACYKAFLEASSVPHLAQIGFLGAPRVLRGKKQIDPTTMGDLDGNVLYYSLPSHVGAIDRHFTTSEKVRASDLPQYPRLSDWEDTKRLLVNFHEQRLRLYYLDLSTPDVQDLGFYVFRTYSPDLLSLSLPSYPQAAHPRYKAYGGFHVSDPHPYP